MSNTACIDFVKSALTEGNIRGKTVIEVGAFTLDSATSSRHFAEALRPSQYIGIDIQNGFGVDQICRAEDLIAKFGYEKFDVLICTELLEHVRNWHYVIHNLKNIIKQSGLLIITTRSKGYLYHPAPFDFWRYELSDIEYIFSDFSIESLKKDWQDPGVFLMARKPHNFIEKDLKGYKLYSIIREKKSSIMLNSIYWVVFTLPIWRILDRTKTSAWTGYYYIKKFKYCVSHPFEALSIIKRKFVYFTKTILFRHKA